MEFKKKALELEIKGYKEQEEILESVIFALTEDKTIDGKMINSKTTKFFKDLEDLNLHSYLKKHFYDNRITDLVLSKRIHLTKEVELAKVQTSSGKERTVKRTITNNLSSDFKVFEPLEDYPTTPTGKYKMDSKKFIMRLEFKLRKVMLDIVKLEKELENLEEISKKYECLKDQFNEFSDNLSITTKELFGIKKIY